jgi:hypothetical protein
MCHHPLEKGGSIFQAKIYNPRYVCPKHCLKSSFGLIFCIYSMILISSMNVKLGKDAFSIQFFQLCSDVGEGTIVTYDPFVEFSVVHYHSVFV